MSKIQKTSKIINRFLSVMSWCGIVVMGFILLEALVTFFGETAPGAEWETSLVLGNYKLTLAEGYDWKNNPVTFAKDLSVLLTAAMALFEIRILKQIFIPMANGLPFQGSVSKALKKMAWVALMFGLIGSAVDFGMNAMIYRLLDIPALFSPEKVSACVLSVTSDGSFIGAFVCLLLLSHVFRYGEELQQLSDETL